MKTIGKNISTKALFNTKDYKTSILRFNLSMDNKHLDISDCKVIVRILKGNKDKVEIEGKILDAENGVVIVGLIGNIVGAGAVGALNYILIILMLLISTQYQKIKMRQ